MDRRENAWEQFCVDEAHSTVVAFMSHVDDYKRRDEGAKRIPNSIFAREFSTALYHAVSAMSNSDHRDDTGSGSRLSGSEDRKLPQNGDSENRSIKLQQESKSWKSIFKRKRDEATDRPSSERSDRRKVMFETHANHLQVGGPLLWRPCRLLVVVSHGTYQIEVYSPPKALVPKMSLFCFLIEKVRSATCLEAPSSSFPFIIKCHQQGEYVFDVESKDLKDAFMNAIQIHCSCATAVGGVLPKSCCCTGQNCSLFNEVGKLPRQEMTEGEQLQLQPQVQSRNSNQRRRARSMLIEYRHHSPTPEPSDRQPAQMETPHPGRTCPDPEAPKPVQWSLTAPEDPANGVSLSALHPVSIAAANRLSIQNNWQRKSSTSSLPGAEPVIATFSLEVPTKKRNPSHNDYLPAAPVVSAFPSRRSPVGDDGSDADVHTPDTTVQVDRSELTDSNTVESQPGAQANSIIGTSPDIETIEGNTDGSNSSWAKSDRDVGNLRALSQYPWFHGLISRSLASELVLVGGADGSGQYLVRQSESREGNFVLTLNYYNRAKHLRLSLNENGCNIQHLWFETVSAMLEHFKTTPIPFESHWPNEDVKLTNYIERSASDGHRTPTVVNLSMVQRAPPRRSHSLHLSSTHQTTSFTGQILDEMQSSSLPHSTRRSIDWRHVFHSRSSSGIAAQDLLQPRQTGALSLLEVQRSPSRERSENNYVYRS